MSTQTTLLFVLLFMLIQTCRGRYVSTDSWAMLTRRSLGPTCVDIPANMSLCYGIEYTQVSGTSIYQGIYTRFCVMHSDAHAEFSRSRNCRRGDSAKQCVDDIDQHQLPRRHTVVPMQRVRARLRQHRTYDTTMSRIVSGCQRSAFYCACFF